MGMMTTNIETLHTKWLNIYVPQVDSKTIKPFFEFQFQFKWSNYNFDK
jgi:hypothetical protein